MERSRKSVTRKEVSGDESKWPHPKACGHKDGTVSWIAFSEAYSPEFVLAFVYILLIKNNAPSNMTSACFPLPVFIKNFFSFPSCRVVVIFAVEADEHPPPPAEETVVFARSALSTAATAESSFMVADNVSFYTGM